MAKEMNTSVPPKRLWNSLKGRCINWYVDAYNSLQRVSKSSTQPSHFTPFEEIRRYASKRTDINEHLPVLFAETIRMRPRLIVEMGVRGGESTYAFERAAQLSDATLLSIDIEDCANVSTYSKWHFIQGDDIALSDSFPDWCKENGLVPEIEVLFIDTSHYYDHTVQEIEKWFPHLADHALVFFHDTNMQNICRRRDGSLGRGWQNDRGVIRAVEDYFGKSFDETRDFVDVDQGWIIRHYAHNSGMTMLERVTTKDMKTT